MTLLLRVNTEFTKRSRIISNWIVKRVILRTAEGLLFVIGGCTAILSDVGHRLKDDLIDTFLEWVGRTPEAVFELCRSRVCASKARGLEVVCKWSTRQRENFCFVENFSFFKEEFMSLVTGVPATIVALDWAITGDLFQRVSLEAVLLLAFTITAAYAVLLVGRIVQLGLLVAARAFCLVGPSVFGGVKALVGCSTYWVQRFKKERSEKSDLFVKSKLFAQACMFLWIWPLTPPGLDLVSVICWALKGWAL